MKICYYKLKDMNWNREYLVPQNRTMSTGSPFSLEIELTLVMCWSYDYPLANHTGSIYQIILSML